ncbi:MAG: hypothetical protein GAK29_01478 [Acinetobacter bereziniae]|uniref:Uncharacterized protein n=1 Tax=Acinetobacter bereziniae TaxID=106648 RepID=A0A833US69_ACIBZ|nr:MAG: hypothetical protein GAK29_01478 [Acinetobacter bereziniae]
MNHTINDSFMNPDRFVYSVIPFKLSDREPRKDIPDWRIARSNARSMGKVSYLYTKPSKCCGSLTRRVYDNSCYECFKLEKK